jgi:hypothetical protein
MRVPGVRRSGHRVGVSLVPKYGLGLGFGLQRLGERHRDHALAALDLHVGHPGHDTEPVGFNPFRPSRRSPADYVMVAAALVVCAALVIWALAG